MADELRTNLSTFRFVIGSLDFSIPPVLRNYTVSGTVPIRSTASIGTGDETLALGDITTIGWIYIRNTDSTNYVTIGPDGSSYPIKLKPNEWMIGRWNAAAIHAKANTAACVIEYLLLPD